MTNRPRNHEIASLAVSAVTREWLRVGAAVDEIKNDYGEDLLIQTSLKGGMDESRIWVQVKGRQTVKKSAKRGTLPALRVPRGHALRWTNTADTVVVVIWDVTQDVGWYTLPQQQFDPFFLLTSQSDSFGLYFHPEDHFDAAAAQRITWISRMRHAAHQLSQARTAERNYSDREMKDAAQAAHGRAIAAAYGFLMKIDLFTEDVAPPEHFDEWVRNAYVNIEDADYFSTPETRLDGAIHLALLMHMDTIAPELGITPVLFEELVQAMGRIYLHHYGSIDNWWNSRA
ncbi:DUF4365 domain-containing protein [Streptomyces tendae]